MTGYKFVIGIFIYGQITYKLFGKTKNNTKMVKTVSIMLIQDPEKIEILNEPTRRQILRLLSDREMTLTQIANELGLSKRSVWYHLRVLLSKDLIVLSRKRVNIYGIEEKYYRAKASMMIGDFNKSSKKIREETLESNRDVVIGYLCAKDPQRPISDEEIEKMTKQFTKTVQEIIENDGNGYKTRNQTKLAIYRKAFKKLEENKWI